MHSIPNLLDRPQLYCNVDGVGELGIGFMCLGWSLLGGLQLHTPGTSVWHRMSTFVIYVAVMLAILHYGTRAIKHRITFPRTGFVEYRARDRYWIPMTIGAGVAALLAAGLGLALRRHWEISTLTSLAVGLLPAAAYVRIAKTVRWKWAVFAILVAGALAIAAIPPEVLDAFANHASLAPAIPGHVIAAYWLTLALYGVALMVSGGISFGLYLRHTQPPAPEEL